MRLRLRFHIQAKFNSVSRRSTGKMGRMGKPEEVGEAAVWLCSPAASFVTGIAMAIDGGFVAQ